MLTFVGASASWEYSVVCPPDTVRSGIEGNRCDIVLLPIDQAATVNITTASSSQVLNVAQETRYGISLKVREVYNQFVLKRVSNTMLYLQLIHLNCTLHVCEYTPHTYRYIHQYCT